ncbi:MAG: hypothetical protein AAF356_05060 [Planctomycetota bacterium]
MGGAVKSVIGVAFLAGVGVFLVVLLLVPVNDRAGPGSTFSVPAAGRPTHHANLRGLLIEGDLRGAEAIARERLSDDAEDRVNLILLAQILEREVGTALFAEGSPGGPGSAAREDVLLLDEATINELRTELRWIWSMVRELTEQRAALRPDDAEAQYQYAFALWGLDERLAAREVWLRAAELTLSGGGTMSGAYNRACCLALAGERSAALEALRGAAGVERIDPAWMRADPDLWPLHAWPEFWDVVDTHERGLRDRSAVRLPGDSQGGDPASPGAGMPADGPDPHPGEPDASDPT